MGTLAFLLYPVVCPSADRIELTNVNKKIGLLKNTLKLNESMQKNYDEILAKKQKNYA